jgi:hypothetical protein
LDTLVDGIMQHKLTLPDEYYALEQEPPPAEKEMVSPTHGVPAHYTIYPVEVWVDPAQREPLRKGVAGQWLTCEQAIAHPRVSPTAQTVCKQLLTREHALDVQYATHPADEQKPEAPRRLLREVPARPTMDALAKKWLSHNRGGVRHLPKPILDAILEAGDRAFNLRVADPYLRYQLQGLGFT